MSQQHPIPPKRPASRFAPRDSETTPKSPSRAPSGLERPPPKPIQRGFNRVDGIHGVPAGQSQPSRLSKGLLCGLVGSGLLLSLALAALLFFLFGEVDPASAPIAESRGVPRTEAAPSSDGAAFAATPPLSEPSPAPIAGATSAALVQASTLVAPVERAQDSGASPVDPQDVQVARDAQAAVDSVSAFAPGPAAEAVPSLESLSSAISSEMAASKPLVEEFTQAATAVPAVPAERSEAGDAPASGQDAVATERSGEDWASTSKGADATVESVASSVKASDGSAPAWKYRPMRLKKPVVAGESARVFSDWNYPEAFKQKLTFRKLSGPDWVRVNLKDGSLTILPPVGSTGSFNLRIELSDGVHEPDVVVCEFTVVD